MGTAIYRSLDTPEPRNPRKVSKRCTRGLPARSVKKVSKKSPNTNFVVFLTHFRVVWDFFDTFLTLRARRFGSTFLRPFGGFGARGRGDSCIWRFPLQPQGLKFQTRLEFRAQKIGDKFGESLGGSQAPPSFWEVPGLPRKFPELPRKFFHDFPGSSLTVELNSNPEVPRNFPRLPRKFPGLPRKFPDFPGGQPLSLGCLT